MFSHNQVTLRSIDLDDIDILYAWSTDWELEMLAGWGPVLSRTAFREKYEARIAQPPNDLLTLGIEVAQRLVGYVQLALIDDSERRAAVGIVVGDKTVWGQGIGSTALRILLDYAFTVRNLERVYAEVYAFNTRSHRLMERAGFTHEGVLRQHEMHNGVRQDMHIFGMLKAEFYERYSTIFTLGDSNPDPTAIGIPADAP
jgi:RimJ/RimL family protein N-acetyltransferase